MSTETPLNARQWLNNWSEPDWAPAPGFDWPAAAKMCEGYARAVLAEAERALRERAKTEMASIVEGDSMLAMGRSHGLAEAADLLAGMRR
jgi:hypothetical protein